MATKEKEVVKEEDPMYKKICDNSNDCSCERTTRVLSDMEVSSCSQCFHVLSWQKISIDKKSAAPKSRAVISEESIGPPAAKTKVVKVEKPALEKMEEALVELAEAGPNIVMAAMPREETDTDKDAAKLREVFAGVDDIMANVQSNTVKTAGQHKEVSASVIPDFNPFEDAEPIEAKPEIGFYQIEKIIRKEKELIRLILINESRTAKFILDKETQEEKANKIEANPTSMIGKYVKAEYFELDDKGNPVNPVYVSVVLKAE